jgi:uncharacterized protein (DUF983 family)
MRDTLDTTPTTSAAAEQVTTAPDRSVWQAMLRGYLKVRDTCPVCGEALHHHRADDGPPYLTLLIVGHIIGPAMLWFYVAFEPDPYTFMAIFMVGATALSLWFLPRLKGVIVGIQWANRMHGFGRP